MDRDSQSERPVPLNGPELKDVWESLYGTREPEEAKRRRAIVHNYRLKLMGEFDISPDQPQTLGELEPEITDPSDPADP